MRALQGWVLLAYGVFIAFAAIVSAHSRIVNIVLAAVSIPFAIGILINDRRSSANQRQH
jgi:predicted TIM-barrel enzyme